MPAKLGTSYLLISTSVPAVITVKGLVVQHPITLAILL